MLLPPGVDRAAVLCAVLAARAGGAPQALDSADSAGSAGSAGSGGSVVAGPEAEPEAGLAVVFCETKRQCREVAERLQVR